MQSILYTPSYGMRLVFTHLVLELSVLCQLLPEDVSVNSVYPPGFLAENCTGGQEDNMSKPGDPNSHLHFGPSS
jgi:hypothetical protein